MPQDTFTYKVELDTQGLTAQLASVRDIVSQGLEQTSRQAVGGVETAGLAANRLSADLMMGQQMVAAAIPAQFLSVPAFGAASTSLANVPGMPQGFFQEVFAAAGISRAPVGVFPSQFQAVAAQRLQERFQAGAQAFAGTAASMGAAGAGAMIGQALIPIPGLGAIAGAIGGYMIGDMLMSPIVSDAQDRMRDRARLTQIFGFNKFTEDQRAQMADFMRQRFTQSIFSPEEFNAILPAAAMGGFLRNVRRGDTQGFQAAFARAERAIQETMFTMQLTGPEGAMQAGQLFQQFRQVGITDAPAQAMMGQARALAGQMFEMGQFVDPMEIAQRQLTMGQVAAQMAMSPQRAMEAFTFQTATINQLVANRRLTSEDVAILGGSSAEAGQRVTMALAGTTRHPLMRALALGFGRVGPGGEVGLDQGALQAVAQGRASLSDVAGRISQELGTGREGATRMLTLLANQGRLQGEMMQNQAQTLRGITDEFLRQGGLELTEGTRMLFMQRMFGVGEAESRVLARGAKAEEMAREELGRRSTEVVRETASAIEQAQSGFARDVTTLTRSIKEAFGGVMDDATRKFSEIFVPSVEKVTEELRSINQKLPGAPMGRGPGGTIENIIGFRGQSGLAG